VGGDLREKRSVKIDETFQHLVVFFPEMNILECIRATLNIYPKKFISTTAPSPSKGEG
jgi:hypothetical protein